MRPLRNFRLVGGGNGIIADLPEGMSVLVCEFYRAFADYPGGAEFLVTAANAHADLVTALRAVEFGGPRHKCMECGGQPVTGHVNHCRIGAALAKASTLRSLQSQEGGTP